MLSFVVESVCKGKSFFCNRQTFSKVFFKKFFRRRKSASTGCRSRSLNAVKVRYLEVPQNRCFLLPFLSDCHLFNVFPSRKRVQNYALFRFLQLLQTLFFKIFARKFINHCGSGMFYGMFCGRRKGNFRRILHILLRACECARVGFVRKIHTEAGRNQKIYQAYPKKA